MRDVDAVATMQTAACATLSKTSIDTDTPRNLKAILGTTCGFLLLLLAFISPVPHCLAAEISPIRLVAPNGMTVLILEQHALPIVEVHAIVKVGSAQDPPDKAGLANLVASLLDEGTASRTSQQIAERIEFVGGSLEARASEDFTSVSARVLRKDSDLGFSLLVDILMHPAFRPEDVERVRTQILGHLISEDDDPEQVAIKAFNQLVFHDHPYRWPTEGTEATLKHVTPIDVAEFYAKEYLPNQTILAIVGDVTQEQASDLVQKHFGSWKSGAAPPRARKSPPTIERKMVQLVQKELTQSTILIGHLGISRTNPDYYAVTVMNYILGAGGFSSRLMDSIRDKQGLAYGIMSHFDTRLMPGAFMVNLQTRTETTNQAISGVLSELKGLRDGPITDQELADAKSFLIGSFPLRFDSTSKLAQVLAQVEFFGLGLDYFTQYPKGIDRVTKEDVMRVAKQYVNPHHYALVVVGDVAKAKVRQ